MKIVLAAVDSKFIHSNLALRYLNEHGERCIKENGLEDEIVLVESTVNENIDDVTERLYKEKGDVYVFSVYIWNVTFVRDLIGNLRLLRKEVVICAGGPEVYYSAEVAMEDIPLDFIFHGEGEELFEDFILYLNGRKSLNDIKGIHHREVEGVYSGRSIFTGIRKAPEMNSVLFPYHEGSLKDLRNRLVYYEAQRGCPYRCAYCLSAMEKNLRRRNLGKVKEELDFFIANRVPLVKFVDRTFNMDEVYSYAILSFIKERKEELGDRMVTAFHMEISAALLSDRTIHLLSSISKNLIQFEIGIQSTNSETLHNVHRFDDMEAVSRNIKALLSTGKVHIHTDLIAGLPGETEETFEKSFNDAMDMEPHMLQMGFLKVLKGTPMEEMKDRFGIVHRDYPPYEVLFTDTMDYDFMTNLKRIENVLDRMWNSGKYINFLKELFIRYQNKFILFSNLAEKLYENLPENGRITEEICNRFSIEFIKENFPDEMELFVDTLRFDHMLRDRSGWYPDILSQYKYNSVKTELSLSGGGSKKLKGTVSGFKINVNDGSENRKSLKETYFWYSLQSDKIFEVYEAFGDFHILREYIYEK